MYAGTLTFRSLFDNIKANRKKKEEESKFYKLSYMKDKNFRNLIKKNSAQKLKFLFRYIW